MQYVDVCIVNEEHTIEGDYNHISVEEVKSLVTGNEVGRLQR